jgi:hypothetical protein
VSLSWPGRQDAARPSAARRRKRVAERAKEAGQPVHVHFGVEIGEDARVVATRFSSAKPAPDGACVRSPSTHQAPSGPRPISKAQEIAGTVPLRLHADQRPQEFGLIGQSVRAAAALPLDQALSP